MSDQNSSSVQNFSSKETSSGNQSSASILSFTAAPADVSSSPDVCVQITLDDITEVMCTEEAYKECLTSKLKEMLCRRDFAVKQIVQIGCN